MSSFNGYIPRQRYLIAYICILFLIYMNYQHIYTVLLDIDMINRAGIKDTVKMHQQLSTTTNMISGSEETVITSWYISSSSLLSSSSYAMKNHSSSYRVVSHRYLDKRQKQNNKNKSKFKKKSSISKVKPNIVLVIADDMNPQYGPYIENSHPLKGSTPRLDDFAKQSVTFSRAFSNFPVCGPCRQSFMAGRLPDTLKIYNFEKWLPQTSPLLTTIPQYFKNVLGYYTAAYGKVYHDSERQPLGNLWNYLDQLSQPIGAFDIYGNLECSTKWYCSVPDKSSLADSEVASGAISFLRKAKSKNISPFLLLVGFRRPHLSNAVPPSLVNDLNVNNDYPDIKEPTIPGASSYRESLSRFVCNEVDDRYVKFDDTPEWRPVVNSVAGRPSINALTDDVRNKEAVLLIRKYYYAAIRMVDDRFGAILDELDNLGYASNTIVIFTSDHGFSNGERGTWCKSTLNDNVTRIPMTIKLPPNLASSESIAGRISNNLVSLIDIFPTLIDLANGEFTTGSGKVVDSSGIPLDGTSFAKNIYFPDEITSSASYTQFPRCQGRGQQQKSNCATGTEDAPCTRDPIQYMGYAIRTRKYKYVEWRPFDEISGGCVRISWRGIPSAIYDKDQKARFLDPSSTTLWDSPPVEQELYYSDTDDQDKIVLNVKDEINNRAINPSKKDQLIMLAMSRMIQYRYNPKVQRLVCNNRGILVLTQKDNNENDFTESCQCDLPWTGKDCSKHLTKAPTMSPTSSPTTGFPTPLPTRKTKHPTPNPTEKTEKPTKSPTITGFGFKCPTDLQKAKCGVVWVDYHQCKSKAGRKHCTWCGGVCHPGNSRKICTDPDLFNKICNSPQPTSLPTDSPANSAPTKFPTKFPINAPI